MTRAADTRRSTGGPNAEAGYATVWALGWIGCCLAVGWVVLLLAAVVARQHHVDGSADLVALSAAQAHQRGDDACASAQRIAAANRVQLGDCTLTRDDVTVAVDDTLELPLGLHLRLIGRARAGPG